MMMYEEQEERVRKLLELSRRGLKKQVEESLDSGDILVDDHDDDDVTPLQAAAAGGHLHLYGWTPVMHAAYHGHLSVLEYLIQKDADFKHTTYLGASALTLAARRGNMNIVKFLLRKGLDLKPKFGADLDLTPVMAAAIHSHDSICRVLLTAGANPNDCIRSTGMSVLMISALFAKASIVEILLESGADPDLTSGSKHSTALDLAVLFGRDDIVKELKSKTTSTQEEGKRGSESLMDAIREKEFHRAKEMIASGEDVVEEETGRTPMMEAAVVGRLDIIEALITNKADPNRQEKVAGYTALMIALENRKPIIARYLIASGVDVNILNWEGKTALDVATTADVDKELLSELAKRSVKQRAKETARRKDSSGKNSGTRLAVVPIWAKRLASRMKNVGVWRSCLLGMQRGRVFSTQDALTFGNNDADLFVEPPLIQNIQFISFEQMLQMGFDVEKEGVSDIPVAILPPNKDGDSLIVAEERSLVPPLDLMWTEEEADLFRSTPSCSTRTVYRSLAHRNAVRMGPGIPKPLKLSKGLDVGGICGVKRKGIHLAEPTRQGRSSGCSMPTLNSGTWSRRRKGSPISGKNLGYTSLLRQRPGMRPPSRPHSYHDGSPGQQNPVQHKEKMIWLSPGGPRPHSFHDTDTDPSWDLPVTPTRKSFGFFTGGPAASNILESPLSKHSSTPLLNAGGSGSSSLSGASAQRFGNTGNSATGYRFQFTDISGEKLAEEQLQEVLRQLSLDEYATIFEEQEVDMETFVTLTDADLMELGIEKQESRSEILVAAQELNRRIVYPEKPSGDEP